MSATLDESPDRHAWTLEGHRVTQICIDLTSVRFESWTLQDSLDVRISGPFELREPDGTGRRIDPTHPEQLAPLLTLLGAEMRTLSVTRAGFLDLGFSEGTQLSIAPRPRREAFTVQGGGSLEGLTYLG